MLLNLRSYVLLQPFYGLAVTPSALLNEAVKLINWGYLACGDALSFLHTASQTMQFGYVPAKNYIGSLAEHLAHLISQPLN